MKHDSGQAVYWCWGHIASTDGEHGDNASYEAGMLRELKEEVAISGDFTSRCVGLINDDATPVGSVHLGIVHYLSYKFLRWNLVRQTCSNVDSNHLRNCSLSASSLKRGLRLLWMQLKPAFLDNIRTNTTGAFIQIW